MNNNHWFLKDYIKPLLNLVYELNKQVQQQDAYRIIEITQDKNGVYTLKVQMIGKSIPPIKYSPQEIAGNDNLMAGFSKQDIRTITYLATVEMLKPKYEIHTQEIKNDSDRVFFKLKRQGSNQLIEKTADEITKDKEILNELNQVDAHKIGYSLRNDQETLIKKFVLDNNKENIP
ncbi:MAG TPA: hypothetical protein VJN02_09070 [Gammaproteobacteria bacterium]|nr:hypothetical protein [Gammaproteobacteria bacterium]